jgi:hypothetical protein
MLAGGAAGALWALAVIWLPGQGPQPFVPVNLALIYAFLPAGLVLMLMIGRIALRRFNNEELMDGSAPAAGTPAEIDQRVLRATIEQCVLALTLWPFIAMSLGSVTVIAMGVSFGVARLVYWGGYRLSPALRMFGFAASFYPTVFGTLWAILRLLT